MKKTILFLLIINTFQLHAQEGFIKGYNFDYPTAIVFNAMLLDEEELIIAGYVVDSVPPYQQGIFLSKLDTMGNLISHTTHFDPSGYSYAAGAGVRPGGLIRLQDGSGYLFTGNIFEGASGFLAKFSVQGDLEWFKVLEDAVSLTGHYYKLIETETGFLVAGSKQVPNGSQSDMYLLKTDKEGNILWEQQYGEVGNGDLLNSLIEINNNEYVLGGLRGAGGSLPATQVQLIAVDSLGQQKWYWESDTPPVANTVNNRGCFGLHHDSITSNWTYATVRVVEESFGVYYETGQFVTRDSNFNLITEREYDEVDGQDNHFYNLVQLSDGDWLGLGTNREILLPPSTISGHIYADMKRISNGKDGMTSLGDSLWTRKFLAFPDSLYSSRQYLHSAVELPSGSIIAAGYFKAFYSGHSDHGLLVKINQHGCIDTLDCIPTNFPNVTSVYLTTCDPSEVGSMEFIYPDQNGEDSIVVETTTLISPPAAPIPPADLLIEESAPPFTITVPAVPTATTYSWTVPSGVQIISGADSTSVSIQWNDQVTNGLVCVSAINECDSSPPACTEVSVNFTDGLEEIKTKGYSIFPNPVDEVLLIVFEEETRYEIVLLDVLGKVVLMKSADSRKGEIITSNLQQGIYWLKITKNRKVFWERVEVLR